MNIKFNNILNIILLIISMIFLLTNVFTINVIDIILIVFLLVITVVNLISLLIDNDKEKIIKKVKKDHFEEILFENKIGIIKYNDNNKIEWVNTYLENLDIFLINKFINKKELDFTKNIITIENEKFLVKRKDEYKIIILENITELEKEKQTFINKTPIIGLLNLDNFSELQKSMSEIDFINLENKVRKKINGWFIEKKILIRKNREDSYLIILQEEKFNEKDYLNFLNDLNEIKVEKENIEISIGFGRGINDLNILFDLSASALDLCLSRGGNQIIINNFNHETKFVTDSRESRMSKYKTKTKVFSKILNNLILKSDKVYLLGHKKADFDCIGAMLGIYQITKKLDKEVKLIIQDNDLENKTKEALYDIFSKKEINEMSLNYEKANRQISENTLLIVLDVSKKEIIGLPSLLDKTKKIAIIDHHIPSEKIENQIYSFQEPSYSSTCEIVSELIKYNEENIKISSNIATLLLAGILLDTNFYKNKTSVRTHEATIFLKELKADSEKANNYLNITLEEIQLKNEIMANSYIPFYGIIISSDPTKRIIEQPYLAIVAEEFIELNEINASFVIGLIDTNKVGISARSKGLINVEKIISKMGGGGKLTAAATQIEGKNIEEVRIKLEREIKDYLEEN